MKRPLREGETRAIDPPPTAPRWYQTWRWLVLVVAVALLAGLAHRGALDVGLLGDDFMHHAMLEGDYPGEGYAPFDLYAFLRDDPELQQRHVERGTAPWWSSLAGDERTEHGTIVFAVLRPLSSALITLDHALASSEEPGAVFAWHLHSLLWFVAMIGAAGLVLRRLFGPAIASLAVVLFALDPAHLVPLAWLANRCALICACFGLLAVWAHLRWRAATEAQTRGERRAWIAAELGCMSLALAGGEYGVIAACYVIGWELAGADGDARARARAIIPSTAPVLVYLTVHQLGGYGTFGEVYVDVFDAPGEWLSTAAQRLPKLLVSACWTVPAATPSADAGASWLTVRQGDTSSDALSRVSLVLIAAFGLALWLARRGLSTHERRALRGLAVGGLLGLLPLTAAPPLPRLLVVSQLGASALIAAILVAAARLLLRRTPPSTALPPPSWPQRLAPLPFAIALLYTHTYTDLRVGQQSIEHIHALESRNLAAFSGGDLLPDDREALRERDVIVLNSLNILIGLHGGYVLDANGWAGPRSWRTLAMAPHALAATRLAPAVLELWTVHGAWLTTPYELNFRRSDQPLQAGDVLERRGLRVEIVETLDGRPTRVRLHFDADLDDPRWLFVTLTKQGLVRWTPPPLYGHGIVPVPQLPAVEAGEPGERVTLRP